MFARPAFALSTLLLACTGAAAAQTAAHDPWSRVPAMPTSYYSDDNFVDLVSQQYDSVNSDIDKQAELNAKIKQSFDQMDVTQKMQRMQAYMMKNPQEAMKTMQAMQAAASTTTGGTTAANNMKLLQELAVHKTNFNETLDKALKPLQARQEEIIKTRTQPSGEAGSEFKTAADAAQYTALVQQENTEYEKHDLGWRSKRQRHRDPVGDHGYAHGWVPLYGRTRRRAGLSGQIERRVQPAPPQKSVVVNGTESQRTAGFRGLWANSGTAQFRSIRRTRR